MGQPDRAGHVVVDRVVDFRREPVTGPILTLLVYFGLGMVVLALAQRIAGKRRELERKRRVLEAQVAALQTEFSTEEAELELLIAAEEQASQRIVDDRGDMARSRQVKGPRGGQG